MLRRPCHYRHQPHPLVAELLRTPAFKDDRMTCEQAGRNLIVRWEHRWLTIFQTRLPRRPAMTSSKLSDTNKLFDPALSSAGRSPRALLAALDVEQGS